MSMTVGCKPGVPTKTIDGARLQQVAVCDAALVPRLPKLALHFPTVVPFMPIISLVVPPQSPDNSFMASILPLKLQPSVISV